MSFSFRRCQTAKALLSSIPQMSYIPKAPDSDAERRLWDSNELLRDAIEELQSRQHSRPNTAGSFPGAIPISHLPCHHASDESCVANAIGNLCQSFLLSYGVRVGIGILLRELARQQSYSSLLDLDVLITPKVISRGVNRAVMRELLDKYGKTDFDDRKPVYDGRKGFYTAGALPFTSKDFPVKLIDKDETGTTIKQREFKLSVKLASRTDLKHLKDFLRSKVKEAPHETVQVLDVVLRKSPSNRCTVVGRSFFQLA